MNQGKINLQFTADITRANMQIRRLHDEMARLRKKVEEANQAQRAGSDRASRSLSRWGSRLAGVAAGYLSVEAAINLVNESLQRQIQLQDQALDEAGAAARGQERLLVQTAGLTTDERQAIFAAADRLAVQYGIKPGEIQLAAASVLSAVGGDREMMERIMHNGLQFVERASDRERADFLGVMGDLTKAGFMPEETARNLMALQVAVRQTQPSQLRFAMRPLIAGEVLADQTRLDEDPQYQRRVALESQALFAAMSQELADKEGQISASAASLTLLSIQRKLPELTGSPFELIEQIDSAYEKALFERTEDILGESVAKGAIRSAIYQGKVYERARNIYDQLNAVTDQAVEDVARTMREGTEGNRELFFDRQRRIVEVATELANRQRIDEAFNRQVIQRVRDTDTRRMNIVERGFERAFLTMGVADETEMAQRMLVQQRQQRSGGSWWATSMERLFMPLHWQIALGLRRRMQSSDQFEQLARGEDPFGGRGLTQRQQQSFFEAARSLQEAEQIQRADAQTAAGMALNRQRTDILFNQQNEALRRAQELETQNMRGTGGPIPPMNDEERREFIDVQRQMRDTLSSTSADTKELARDASDTQRANAANIQQMAAGRSVGRYQEN